MNNSQPASSELQYSSWKDSHKEERTHRQESTSQSHCIIDQEKQHKKTKKTA
jgi:hypothetical protein